VCDGHVGRFFVNEYFDFNGNNEWAHSRARTLWRTLVGTDPPESVQEAAVRRGELIMSLPDQIEIRQKNNWWHVHSWHQ
jgi:hypothetical protein